VHDVALETIGGVRYIGFSTDEPDLERLSRLSVAYALFARESEALVPVEMPNPHVFDDDLLSIQRYTGKTNEHFTKLLVNLTAANASFGDRVTLLDPLAGRGTTLHQAALYGWDALGVEVDTKDFEAYRTFFITWLKNKRLPHKAKEDAVRVGNGPKQSRLTVEFAADRAAFDAGTGQRVAMINGDARDADRYFKNNSVDLIVADLPYGVRHGAATKQSTVRERSPLELVESCLHSWTTALRSRGAIGLAFNTHTCQRQSLVRLLDDAGLEVRDDGAYAHFAHRVDQSINRDLVVARRAVSTARDA
jgi:23S rRNA G2445 N2-methylase RlmL